MAIRSWQSVRIIFIWVLTVLIFLIFAAADDVLRPTRILLLGLWLLSTMIASVITWIWLSNRDRRDELS